MKPINISTNKTLKLNNVLKYVIYLSQADTITFDNEINKMISFINNRGAKQIGPLIQFSDIHINGDECDICMQFMLQADNYIHNVEPPYQMESVVRVKNCLYAHYTGPEEKLKFAYDKLGVYAFENDIELQGCNYTVYVDRNEESDTIVADVFMPVKQD